MSYLVLQRPEGGNRGLRQDDLFPVAEKICGEIISMFQYKYYLLCTQNQVNNELR